jgi:penicillin-binding protein 2
MVRAIQVSCNVYFYQLMLKVGLDNWAEIGRQFGFGRATGIDIAEESPGLLPTTGYMNKRYGPNGWTKGYTVSLAIGQGELGVTPLQMACYAMALANQGDYHQPHAVLGIVNRETNRVDTLMTNTRAITLKPSTWSLVREGMRRVVMEPGGTGGMARIPGVQVAGKTGTAQNPHGKDHAWFVGFAPFDNPVIAICVLVENAGFGGSFAAPIAAKCMERYLRNEGMLPAPVPPSRIASAETGGTH